MSAPAVGLTTEKESSPVRSAARLVVVLAWAVLLLMGFGLAQDFIHASERLDGIVSDRGFGREHGGVGPVAGV